MTFENRRVEFTVNAEVEGEVSGKAQTIRRADVVLQGVDIRVREAALDIERRDKGDLPGKPNAPERRETVRYIGGQVGKKIRPDDRLPKCAEEFREHVQITAALAVKVCGGKVDTLVRRVNGRGFQLVVARGTGVLEKHRRAGACQGCRIRHENVERGTPEIANPRAQLPGDLPFHFDSPSGGVRCGVEMGATGKHLQPASRPLGAAVGKSCWGK